MRKNAMRFIRLSKPSEQKARKISNLIKMTTKPQEAKK